MPYRCDLHKGHDYKVYIHTNLINNKKYIGVTQQNPKKRWQNGYGYIKNPLFYKAIKKYTWDNFKHEIIFCNLTKEQAEMFEIALIKYYKSNNPQFGYNISNGGNFIGTHSEESKRKISEAHKGEKNCFYGVRRFGKDNPMFGKYGELHHNYDKGIKVICIETNEVFNSFASAGRKFNTSKSSIRNVCLNLQSHTKGFHFKFYGEK